MEYSYQGEKEEEEEFEEEGEFDMLNDDMLYYLCQGMSDRDLEKFAGTSKRIGSICGEILRNRKEKYFKKVQEKSGSIRGYTIGGNFYIKKIDPEYGPDARIINRGRYCNAFSRAEIITMILSLGVNPSFDLNLLRKNQLCNFLAGILRRHGLMDAPDPRVLAARQRIRERRAQRAKQTGKEEVD